MTDEITIHDRLLQVASALDECISKGGRNAAQGYNFRGIDQVMDALHKPLVDAGIVFLPSYALIGVEDRPTQSGGVMQYARVEGCFTFTDGTDHVLVTTIGQGNDTSDKAVNKAMSAALKYALLQTFMVPIGDDDGDSVSIEMGSSPEPAHRESAPAPRRETKAPRSGGGPAGKKANFADADPEEANHIHKASSANPDNAFLKSISDSLRSYGSWSPAQRAKAMSTAKDLIGPITRGGPSFEGAETIEASFPGAVEETGWDQNGTEPF